MKINKGLLFSIVVVMLTSVFTYGAAQGIAADGGASIAAYAETDDPDTFDAVVHYNDKIQITYLVMNKDGTFTQGPGDIQLGVLNAGGQTVIRQLYCAAATVHFHTSNIITHPSGQPYVDEANGYVLATPDRADADTTELARNMDQVMWLIKYGYYGDNTGLSVNNTSVKSLEARYPGIGLSDTPNRAEIAVIATKIAIWHFTDPMVAILSTSLSKADQIKMYDLVKALIAGANEYAEGGSPAPIGMQMDLEIDDSAAGFTTIAATAANELYYYGPLTVKSTSDDIQNNMDKIFLTLGGRYGSSRLVKDDGGLPINEPLDEDIAYGNPNLPYPEFDEPYVTAGQKFWVEASSYSCPDLSGVTIDAEARANSVTFTEATPQLVVYGASDGTQDWTEVQAFVGLMETGAKGDIYGRARLDLHGGVGLAPGHISVTKIMLDIDGNVVTPKADQSFLVNLLATPAGVGPGPPAYMFVLNKSNDWSRTLEVSNGAYTVNELTSPTQSYKLIAQSAGEVTIDNNDDETSTAAIWVKNQEQSGKVIINKIVRDAEGKTATPLDRDLFVVNLDGAEKDVSVGFKNATGYSSGEIKLPVGEYSVSEILDNRYSRIDNIDSINIEADETVTLDITNRQHEGRIKVKKIVKINGQETAPSSGDAFIVTIVDEADANNTFTATLNSANHWEETVSGIPVGDYKVTETGGGHGWEISYSTQTVKVTDGSSHEVTVTNSKTVNPDDNKPSDNTPSNNNNDNNNNNNNDNNSNNNDNNNNDNDSNDDDDNGDNDNDENGGSADTSDQIPLGLWTWLLCISGVGIIAAATLRRSRLLVTGRRRK